MNEKALSLKSPKLLTGITNEDFDEQPQQLDTQTQSLEDACSEVEINHRCSACSRREQTADL